MNYKAIDAGVDAVHKVEVPASWSNPAADPAPKKLTGRPETVKMVEDLMNPISLMDGDSLPVSAFMGNPDGQFEHGAAAYEKRGTAVTVPTWNADSASVLHPKVSVLISKHPLPSSCSKMPFPSTPLFQRYTD